MDAGFLKAFFSIVAVVAMFGAILFALKKYLKRRTAASGDIDIKVVSKVALHQKSFLCVVKVGMRTLLVGVSDNNVSLISDVSDEFYEPDSIPQNPSQADLESIARSAILKKRIKQQPPQRNQTTIPVHADDSTSFGAYLKTAFKRSTN